MNGLYHLFEKINPLPEEFWKDFNSGTTETIFPRKTLLLAQNKIADDIYFIVKGLARAYYFKNDTDVTSRFMRENELIISVSSFFRKIPSHENIVLVEDSLLIPMTSRHISSLLAKYPAFTNVMRAFTEHLYTQSEDRVYAMRMKSGRERYEDLLQHDPQIFQRVPLKHIASYLGMKAETLSRIRSRIRY